MRVVEFDGEEWLYFQAIPVDVAIIRGTTADELGNLSMEHEGAYLGALEQALAARNNGGIVIAQVKRVTAAGSHPGPAGARAGRPGRPRRRRPRADADDPNPLRPGDQRRDRGAARPLRAGRVGRRQGDRPPRRDGAARRARRSTSASASRRWCRGSCSKRVRATPSPGSIEQGAVGGVPLLGFAFGCAANAQAIVPSPQQFAYFQGGGFDRTFLSFLQVDGDGSVNVSQAGGQAARHRRRRRLRRHHRPRASASSSAAT